MEEMPFTISKKKKKKLTALHKEKWRLFSVCVCREGICRHLQIWSLRDGKPLECFEQRHEMIWFMCLHDNVVVRWEKTAGAKGAGRTRGRGYNPPVLNWRQFCLPGDILAIFGCHNCGRGGCYLHLVGREARDTAKHPTMHRIARPQKNYWPPMSMVSRVRNCHKMW